MREPAAGAAISPDGGRATAESEAGTNFDEPEPDALTFGVVPATSAAGGGKTAAGTAAVTLTEAVRVESKSRLMRFKSARISDAC